MTDGWTFALITPDGVVGEAFDSIVELLRTMRSGTGRWRSPEFPAGPRRCGPVFP
ncbi:hypothetical protein [Amycolatopsis sp. cg13]|uniref:hypothetical protein n=1 Tax=Amycolatopsis sp. cg13 TaxID=3238807 RepID=UPI003526471F